ncbi:hypothetical protein ME805_09490 [Lactobacillus delbrueckii]|nr:hypothetical protein ME803_06650 [Lactobacillus delbrueckii]GHN58725.1 hypothetical protein ME805_09490 [Lactobacillus delbrueckii]
MRMFMAVLWPILLVASAAMTTISYRKKKMVRLIKITIQLEGGAALPLCLC